MATSYKVNILSAEETINLKKSVNSWGNIKKFIGLNIHEEDTAYLISAMLTMKYSGLRFSNGWNRGPVGGGIFIGCEGVPAISNNGEIGIVFNKYGNIYKFLRVAAGEAETIKGIKDKLANELKKFWNDMTPNNELEITVEATNNIDSNRYNIKINWNEYRTLYEVLKGRDVAKIKKKYGNAAYGRMIGTECTDQFVLTAIETMESEINGLIENRNSSMKKLEEEHREFNRQTYEKQKKEKEVLEQHFKDQIAAIEEQIKMMRACPQISL